MISSTLRVLERFGLFLVEAKAIRAKDEAEKLLGIFPKGNGFGYVGAYCEGTTDFRKGVMTAALRAEEERIYLNFDPRESKQLSQYFLQDGQTTDIHHNIMAGNFGQAA